MNAGFETFKALEFTYEQYRGMLRFHGRVIQVILLIELPSGRPSRISVSYQGEKGSSHATRMAYVQKRIEEGWLDEALGLARHLYGDGTHGCQCW